MSVRRTTHALGACLLIAASAITFAQSARAETGFLWFESATAVPSSQISSSPHWKRVHRAKPASAINYVARPQAVEVAAATPVRSDCFWCNARITGLAF